MADTPDDLESRGADRSSSPSQTSTRSHPVVVALVGSSDATAQTSLSSDHAEGDPLDNQSPSSGFDELSANGLPRYAPSSQEDTENPTELTLAPDLGPAGLPHAPGSQEDIENSKELALAPVFGPDRRRHRSVEHTIQGLAIADAEQGDGEQPGTTSESAPLEDARMNSIQRQRSPTNAPASCNDENKGVFFSKLARTWWALVGSIALNIALLVVVVVSVTGNSSGDNVTPTSTNEATLFDGSPTLEDIKTRGVLLCGVTPGLHGFSVHNGTTYEGFEADLCRSIAAVALGSASHVKFVAVEAKEMFKALQRGDVDVLASHVTLTMQRDVFEASAQAGFTFSVPYLYDGLTFGGLPMYADCANRLDTTGNCTSLRICALEGSTHASVVDELESRPQLDLLPTMKAFYEAFKDGTCNVIAGDRFEVSKAAVERHGYTGEYDVGKNLHSHDPLSLVTRDDDVGWSDMVQWVIQTLLAAEEQGVFNGNTKRLGSSEFCGDSLATDIFRNAISAVDNYGEIYARHLQRIVPRGKINTINTEGDSGLIYSFPFGSLETDGPEPTEGGTLRRIIDRGHLRCGVIRSPGFGDFNSTTGVWSGLDVDFCHAISAAIFSGRKDTVHFREVTATERFKLLANGDIDVLSRTTVWNLQRDVMEPTSGVGFSYSQPVFYDSVRVGGASTYGKCADNLDITSPACQNLTLCVVDGTTTINVARANFPERVLVPLPTQEQVIAGLSNGACNAIIGIGLQITEPSVRENGYAGDYQKGERRFSKDPLSIVTRQDDPQFTAFVNLIVTATFYAEEQGIDQKDGGEMPWVDVFGRNLSRMLLNAIEAVGNYGEIYRRSVEAYVRREGLNDLNKIPYGPQHYPLPSGI